MPSYDAELGRLQRELERNPSEEVAAAILKLKMRLGEISPNNIKFCAAIGVPSCLLLFDESPELISNLVEERFPNNKSILDFSTYILKKTFPVIESKKVVNIYFDRLRGLLRYLVNENPLLLIGSNSITLGVAVTDMSTYLGLIPINSEYSDQYEYINTLLNILRRLAVYQDTFENHVVKTMFREFTSEDGLFQVNISKYGLGNFQDIIAECLLVEKPRLLDE